MSGILAVAGAIYLPAVIYVVFIPGGIIWLCWVLIACGIRQLNNIIFWGISLLWNGGWLTFFLIECTKHPSGPIHLVIHSSFAVFFSIAAIVLNATSRPRTNGDRSSA
ncbi:MAG TPA: hypothetical protein DDW52_18805 [Planctomycetaceae bacterium]|nr:hypothetical protein [Planctomycetaceae bacterium]